MRPAAPQLFPNTFFAPASCDVMRTSDMPASTSAGAEIVRMPGLHARPLNDGASIRTVIMFAFRLLRPADGRVLPPLLPPIDGQVEQTVTVVHCFDTAA